MLSYHIWNLLTTKGTFMSVLNFSSFISCLRMIIFIISYIKIYYYTTTIR